MKEEQLSQLNKITELFTKEYEEDILLRKILKIAKDITGANKICIMLINAPSNTLEVKINRGFDELSEQRSFKIKAYKKANNFIKKLFKNKNNLLILALCSRNTTRGFIILEVDKLNKTHLALLKILSAIGGTLIEHAKLSAIAEHRAKELFILNKISTIISSTFDQSTIINQLVNNLFEVLKMDIISVLLIDVVNTEECLFYIISHYHLKEELIEKLKEEMLDNLKDIIIGDFKKKQIKLMPIFKKETYYKKNSLKSSLFLPLKIREKVIGGIMIFSYQEEVFSEDDKRMLACLVPQVAMALENAKIYLDIQSLYSSTIEALAAEIETRNPYTKGHSEKVTRYSVEIAKRLNLDEYQITTIQYAGLLHDLGKIGISDKILLKPGRLTDEEYEEIKEHPIKSENVIKVLAFLKDILPIIRHHHERYDGGGYPDGLVGELIPLGARIIAVADAYDAMTSDRPYRKALPEKEAKRILIEGAGGQFDPHIVKIFLQILEGYGKEE